LETDHVHALRVSHTFRSIAGARVVAAANESKRQARSGLAYGKRSEASASTSVISANPKLAVITTVDARLSNASHSMNGINDGFSSPRQSRHRFPCSCLVSDGIKHRSRSSAMRNRARSLCARLVCRVRWHQPKSLFLHMLF